MKRLTKRINERYGPADIFCLEWIGACLCRLAAIEDILGDKYDLSAIARVVRCKDCRYYQTAKVNEKGFLICPASGMEITENDFCSYGEPPEAAMKAGEQE